MEIEPSKTALIRFGSRSLGSPGGDGAVPRTFGFLGLTHYMGRSRRGRFVVGRKTDGQRVCQKLKLLDVRLRSLRAHGGAAMVEYVARHLRGHLQYYGVSGNARGVATYFYRAAGLLFKWLNRRSQRRSFTWSGFHVAIGRLLPRVRIVHDLYPIPWWKTQTGSRMV